MLSRNFLNRLNLVKRCYCSSKVTTENDGLSSFMNIVKSTEKELKEQIEKKDNIEDFQNKETSPAKFSTLFRNSDLVKLGYLKNGFMTKGIITNVMRDTVFIDYGGKFQLITQKPEKNREFYVRGAEVLIKILDWELTARFIGSETDSTLCESEGKIIKLLSSPFASNQPLNELEKDEKLNDEKNEDMDEVNYYFKNLQNIEKISSKEPSNEHKSEGKTVKLSSSSFESNQTLNEINKDDKINVEKDKENIEETSRKEIPNDTEDNTKDDVPKDNF